jgi:hypothetical protein
MKLNHWSSRRRLRTLLPALALLLAPLGLAATPALAAEPTPDCTTSDGISTCTVTFGYSGAPAIWTVPAGVTTATFDLYGAQGGGGALGGAGGRITATLGVSAGGSYQILVGGQNGYNGGGAGGIRGLGTPGYNGGGASDVRGGSFALGGRLLVAGGGGGGTRGELGDEVSGGAGGYPSGASGAGIPPYCDDTGGAGGTQSEGGFGGGTNMFSGQGGLGQGGEGEYDDNGAGSGGGGGYFGGGGGSGCFYGGGSGGGGSSYVTPAATDMNFQNGKRQGDGQIQISYSFGYHFSGFSAPVDNLPTVNSANAGRSIPLKWRLTDASGSPIANLDGVSVTSVAGGCSASAPSDSLEEYASTNSGFKNLGDGNYQYNWQTQKSWAGSCRTLKLDLGGQVVTALFQFR